MADEIRRLSDDLARDPSSLVFLPLADALRRAGQLDVALRVALRGLDRHPYVADAHDVLARIHADRGDLEQAIRLLKEEPGEGLWLGGVTLPLALADLGLIDEYEFVVQPVLAGHGPTLLAGLREPLELKLVGRQEFRSGAVALRYETGRVTA